eukprot:TRINITY_DN432_c0_g1_i1.p1 TRINITY_DN432_c0_g1~~TRINITY_DN432_c0_g1_i1.p1  ORF type:complete len:129 (-),score=17.74 TRINITY_DN432_c0_g1_i1:286-672(-)
MAAQVQRQFQYSLCSCCDDIPLCLLTWCLPCVTYGRTQSLVEKGDDSSWVMWCAIWSVVQYFTGMGCVLQIMTRNNLRKKNNIDGSMCGDICTVCWCPLCQLQQEAREVGQQGCSGASSNAVAPASMK